MADNNKNSKFNKEIDDEQLDKAAGGTFIQTKTLPTFPENDISDEQKEFLKEFSKKFHTK